jgi:hypothetical protein
MISKFFPVLIIPVAAVALAAIPLIQDLDTVSAITTVLRDLPSLGVVVWIVFWLQGRHSETVRMIMAEMVKRETARDEYNEKIIDALLRTLERPSK